MAERKATNSLPNATVYMMGIEEPAKCARVTDGQYTALQSHLSSIGMSSSVCSGNGTALRPPNGLAFCCRERAGNSGQNTNDLAREAVSCNAVFGGNLVADV